MPSWTSEEVEQLEDTFYLSTKDELKSQFDRSYESIRRKAYRLDLERHENIRRITAVKNVDQINLDNVDDDFANFICGFVAGEGTFTQSKRDTGTDRYRFGIALADDDAEILEDIKNTFGCGNLNSYAPREQTHKGSVNYQINGFGEVVNRVIPFFDEYGLRSSRKQRQYNEWRKEVLSELPNNRKI